MRWFILFCHSILQRTNFFHDTLTWQSIPRCIQLCFACPSNSGSDQTVARAPTQPPSCTRILSATHSAAHSLSHALTQPPTRPHTNSVTDSATRSLSHLLCLTLTHSHACALTDLHTYSLSHTFTRTLNHSRTHSIAHIHSLIPLTHKATLSQPQMQTHTRTPTFAHSHSATRSTCSLEISIWNFMLDSYVAGQWFLAIN